MAAHLQHYWVMVGRFSEGRRWLDRLLVSVPSSVARPRSRPRGRRSARGAPGRRRTRGGRCSPRRRRLATDLGDPTWRAHACTGGRSPRCSGATLRGRSASSRRRWPCTRGATTRSAYRSRSCSSPRRTRSWATPTGRSATPRSASRLSEAARRAVVCRRWRGGPRPSIVWHRGEVAGHAPTRRRPCGSSSRSATGSAWRCPSRWWPGPLCRDGRHQEAVRLLGAVMAALRSIGGELFRHLQSTTTSAASTAAARRWGSAGFQQALDRAPASSFDEAVGLALGSQRSAPRPGAEPRGRRAPDQAGDGDRRAGRRGADQPRDRRAAVHLPAHRRGPRRPDHAQAGLHHPRADRRLGGRSDAIADESDARWSGPTSDLRQNFLGECRQCRDGRSQTAASA